MTAWVEEKMLIRLLISILSSYLCPDQELLRRKRKDGELGQKDEETFE